MSQKGQLRTRKGPPLEIFWSFSPSRPKTKKTPFLTVVPKRTRKGQEKDKKGQEKDNKGREKDKGSIFIDLFLKGQKGQEKTKNIKGAP